MLQNQDSVAAILGESVGERAAGAAGPHDDEIDFH
jgi:hypothetical protein